MTGPGLRRWSAVVRGVAGLVSAGTLVVAVVLLASHWLAPAVLGSASTTGGGGTAGLGRADGARLSRAVPQLAAGLLGELGRLRTRAAGVGPRLTVGAATVLLCLVALWWGWWS